MAELEEHQYTCDDVNTLTKREKQVFHMLLKGMKAKEIAHEFSISIWGANYFVKQIYRKLKVNSKSELIVRYFDCRSSHEEQELKT